MKINKIFMNLVNYIVCFLLSFSLVLNFNIAYDGKYPSEFIENFHFNFKFWIITLICSLVIFFIFGLILKLLEKKFVCKENKINSKKLALFTFLGIFISGVIFLITYYPGVGMNDTLHIIDGPVATGRQHALFYNLWLSVTYRIFFKIVSNVNGAFFLTSLVQLIIVDLIITILVCWFNEKFKNKVSTVILVFYFICTPIITNYNVALVKDSLFAVVLLLHIPFLYEIFSSKGEIFSNKKFLLLYLFVSIVTIYIRNNGIYILLFTLICLLVRYRKYWKQFLCLTFSLLLLSKIPDLILPNSIEYFQEKVAIPIQQISYVMKNNYDSINKDDQIYLNKIIPVSEVIKNYNPYSVDTIKWNENFDREYQNKTSGKYIKTWSHLLISNFEGYVKSYLLMTYDLWTINKFNPIQSRFLYVDKYDYLGTRFNELENTKVFPNTIQTFLESFYDNCVVYFNNGMCFIILLLVNTYIFNKKKDLLILSLPLVGIWLTLMISAPISYALRYMSPYIYCLPFIILITIQVLNIETDKKKKS